MVPNARSGLPQRAFSHPPAAGTRASRVNIQRLDGRRSGVSEAD